MARDVLLAAVIGAQGLKGEVKVKTLHRHARSPARYGALQGRHGKQFEITAFRPAKDGRGGDFVCRRRRPRAAEALKGTELFVARDALPPPDEDEFYHADLIGLEAQDSEGRVLGKVAAIHNFGAGDVIELVAARWRQCASGLHPRDRAGDRYRRRPHRGRGARRRRGRSCE